MICILPLFSEMLTKQWWALEDNEVLLIVEILRFFATNYHLLQKQISISYGIN